MSGIGSVRGARALERTSDLDVHALARRLDPRIGDDVAAVRTRVRSVALKVDPTVEGVHFARGLRDPRAIARKAMRRPASDLAAAGAEPRFALVALALPPGTTRDFARSLVRALAAAAREMGARLVGGHTGVRPGPLELNVTLVGECERPRRRSGARAGDRLLATGSFGGSILAKHLRFRPRLRESRALADGGIVVRAAIDVSDGLALDAARLASASRLALELDEASIPIAAAARSLARSDRESPLSHALRDGEDYELLLAIAPREVPRALSVARRARFPLTVIGTFCRGRGLRLRRRTGRVETLRAAGFVHRA